MSNRLIIPRNYLSQYGKHIFTNGHIKDRQTPHKQEKQESGPLDSIKPKTEMDPAELARKRKAAEEAVLPTEYVKKKNKEKRNTIKFIL